MNKKNNYKKMMLFIFTVLIVISSYQITATDINLKNPYEIINQDFHKKNFQKASYQIFEDGNWPLVYDRYAEDASREIILDSEENIITTGYTADDETYEIDFLTLKYNHDGELLWDKVFDGGKNDYAWDIDVDSEDNIIVFGFNASLIAEDISDLNLTIYLIKYSSDGNELWNKTIEFEDDCFPGGIAVDSEDNIILTFGRGNLNAMSFFCYTIKMDKDGNEIWNKPYTEYMLSFGSEVVINENDEIFIGGLAASFLGEGWFLIKYDPNGNLQWKQRFSIGNQLNDIAIDSEGNMIIVGQEFSRETNSTEWVTFKCDSNGNLLWSYDYIGFYNEYANDAYVDSNGNIFVIGIISKGESYDNCMLIFDPDGNELCMKIPTVDGSLAGITIDKDDVIYASGIVNSSIDSYNYDSYICKFDDVTPPIVESFKPESKNLYLFDYKLFPLIKNTLIIGKITPGAIVTNSSDVDKVLFYVDGILKETVNDPPYEWIWDEQKFGSYNLEIHVYDHKNNINREIIKVWKLF